MRIEEYYFQLRHALTDYELHESIHTTVKEISSLLFCTERNTKNLLKRMCENEWISWKPSRGRGRKSTLTFKISVDELKLAIAKEMFIDGKYNQAIDIINDSNPDIMDKFNQLLYQQFGHYSINEQEEAIDILRFPYHNRHVVFDPLMNLKSNDILIMSQVFDPLVTFDESTQTVKPHLAFHWESNDDCTKWKFYLNKNIKFHHGRELIAEDVKGSIERLRKCSPFNDIFSIISSIKTYKNTVVFYLREANSLFPNFLSCPRASILPMDIYSPEEIPFKGNPVGTGAYRLETNDDEKIVLRANEYYFNVPPYMDKIELYKLPHKYMDSYQFLPSKDFMNIQKQKNREYNEISQMFNGANFLCFNPSFNGPQQNKLFRAALFCALDRDEMLDHLNDENLVVANSLISENDDCREFATDRLYAEKLLKDIQYTGETIKMLVPIIQREDSLSEAAQKIKDQCSIVGINIEVNEVNFDPNTFEKHLSNHHICIAQYGLNNNILYALYLTYTYYLQPFIKLMDNDFITYVDTVIKQVVSPNTDIKTKYDLMLNIEERLVKDKLMMFLYRKRKAVYIKQSEEIAGLKFNYYGQMKIEKSWYKH